MPYGEDAGMGLPGMGMYMGAQAAAFNLSSLTTGFYGKPGASAGGLMRYLSGKTPDVGVARKLAGRTWAGGQYGKYATKYTGLGNFAPSLGHLLPSRYLTLWAGLSGSEGALQGLTAMATINKAMSHGVPGQSFDQVSRAMFNDLPAYSYKGSMRSPGFFDEFVRRPVSTGDVPLKWGEAMAGGRGTTLGRMRTLQGMIVNSRMGSTGGLAEFGAKRMATEAGFLGPQAGKMSNAVAGWMVKNVPKSALLQGMGKSIPFLARGVGAATVGFDLYSIGMMAGQGLSKVVTGAMNRQTNMYNRMTSDIHRGTFMSSSPLSPFVGATGRQRAMANVFEKQLNLRQALGNEAAYMSNMM